MSKLDVIEALVAEGIRKNLDANRKYLAPRERTTVAADSAAVAIAVLIDMTGGHHHIVQADGETFTLQHPLIERLTGDLFDCSIHARIAAGEPLEKGRYRVLMNDDPTDFDLIPLKEFA
ncbi:DUF6085 family protein [Microbacterium esteraromaticum]|uniref:DUF6085 family protein n=1 Tax=Microbacterium esteraromaticum TaxID=57043 RepID=UPI0019D3FD1C|nr:DUF6085 family protein [Microbacterium esteraromaticum]MBN7792399.1 hypothetical protein [Microbacterium esteraromaticum]WDH80171.1 DUF6085 family protein [Microbacterium esteraromaticum]